LGDGCFDRGTQRFRASSTDDTGLGPSARTLDQLAS
jgi:hypothetical protein